MLLLKPNGRAKCGVLIVCIDETRPPRMPFHSSSTWSIFFVKRIWQSWLADNQRTQPHTLFIETPYDSEGYAQFELVFTKKDANHKNCAHFISFGSNMFAILLKNQTQTKCKTIVEHPPVQRNHSRSCIRFDVSKNCLCLIWLIKVR